MGKYWRSEIRRFNPGLMALGLVYRLRQYGLRNWVPRNAKESLSTPPAWWRGNYDAGLLTGILKGGKDFQVVEIAGWVLGDRVCR